jgi:hypothetical protein
VVPTGRVGLDFSIVVQVFAIGLGAVWPDVNYLFRHALLLLNYWQEPWRAPNPGARTGSCSS